MLFERQRRRRSATIRAVRVIAELMEHLKIEFSAIGRQFEQSARVMRTGARCRPVEISKCVERKSGTGPDAICARLLSAETVDHGVVVFCARRRKLENRAFIVGAAKVCDAKDVAAGIQHQLAEWRTAARARWRRTKTVQRPG